MKRINFGKVATFRNGLNFGRESHGDGCLIIGVPDFKGGTTPNIHSLRQINASGIVSEEDFVKKGDILFVRSNGNKNLVGRSLYIDKNIEAVFSGFCIRARLHSNILDPRFCFYFTKTETFKSFISASGGTSIQNLNQEILSNVGFPLFSIDEQNSIVKILSSLDKKIELNNRINAELEAMAKTIYDYWFVQFDFPNAKGKPYKASGGKMVWSAELKRDIPVGWEVKPLSEITSVSNDSLNPMDSPDKEYRHYSIPGYDELGTYKIEKGEEIKSNKFTVKDTDVLVSKLNPWFSRVIYATDDKDLICSTEFVVWRAKNLAFKNYLYMIARDSSFITHCTQSAAGTSNSHKRVNPTVMMKYQIVFNETIAEKFANLIGSTIKMCAKNQVENQKLSELRDWLLPMLMNGQVKVGELERELELAAEPELAYSKLKSSESQ